MLYYTESSTKTTVVMKCVSFTEAELKMYCYRKQIGRKRGKLQTIPEKITCVSSSKLLSLELVTVSQEALVSHESSELGTSESTT